MEHFADEVWTDFIRGIEFPGRNELELHLEKGCPDCIASRNRWSQVHAIALREGNYAPPENLVRMTKLLFAENMSGAPVSQLAELTFDTFMNPALAGVRSAGAAAARQMVYEVDGLAIDLRFDSSPVSKLLNMTGQVLDKRVPRTPLEDSEVILWTQKGLPVAETKANAYGEFNVEFAPQNNLRLSIKVGGRPHIRIHLANLLADPEWDAKKDGSDLSN